MMVRVIVHSGVCESGHRPGSFSLLRQHVLAGVDGVGRQDFAGAAVDHCA